jgi:hypothetical protein
MKVIFTLLILSSLIGCKEFYDEDYKNFESSTDNVNNEDLRNTSYFAELKTVDFNVPNLSGTARITVKDEEVKVSLTASGIPANLIQLHYTYLNVSCRDLSFVLPNDNLITRTYQINETTSTDALENDLISSGASTGSGDINLLGKSLIVKAFTNFPDIPNTSGTNQLTILCGEIKLETINTNQ